MNWRIHSRNCPVPLPCGRAHAPRLACALLVMLTTMSAQVQAASWVVQVGGSGRLAFNPQTLTIQPGDTVRFANLGGFHNVMADDGSFRCARGCDNDGSGGNGSASTQIWSATVAFPNPGQFGYFCEPHGSPGEGMFGTIVVQGPAIPVGVRGWTYAALLAALLLITAAFRLRGSALARSITQARKPM